MTKEAKVKKRRQRKTKSQTVPRDIVKLEFQDKLNGVDHLCIVVVQISPDFRVSEEKCFIKYWVDVWNNKVISSKILQGKPRMAYFERFHSSIRRYMTSKITAASLPQYFLECGIDIVSRGELVEIRRK